jgi:hypothetical protein
MARCSEIATPLIPAATLLARTNNIVATNKAGEKHISNNDAAAEDNENIKCDAVSRR